MSSSASATAAPAAIPAPVNRVRVFVDFWNYSLSMRSVDAAFQTDWSTIGGVLAAEAARITSPGLPFQYQGMDVFASFDPNKQNDKPLRRWLTNTLPRFAGNTVSVVERRPKAAPPNCPVCHTAVPTCTACGGDMRGTEEKGVDTLLATEMIRLAWDNDYDVAVLVSSDRDFVPVVNFLKAKGKKIVHGAFPPWAAQLSAACWASFDLPRMRTGFQRT